MEKFFKDNWGWLLVAVLIITFLLPFVLTRSGIISFVGLGEVGDVIGGTTAPFLSIVGSILVYLALRSQINANDEIKKQFDQNQRESSDDFTYKSLKERVELVIREVNSFNISFHKNRLISNINEIHGTQGKKYNFTGVQAINLFLLEYFKIKNTRTGQEVFDSMDSSHSIFLNITNLIGLFVNTHRAVIESSLPEVYKLELEQFLEYVYFSKITYFAELFIVNDPKDKLNLSIQEVYEYYKL